MNWFSNFYGRTQNPLPVAKDPFDSAVIKAAVASLGEAFWHKTKRAQRIVGGLKLAASVKERPLPKPKPTPNPNSYGELRKKMLAEL